MFYDKLLFSLNDLIKPFKVKTVMTICLIDLNMYLKVADLEEIIYKYKPKK